MISQNEKFFIWSAIKPDLSNLQWKESFVYIRLWVVVVRAVGMVKEAERIPWGVIGTGDDMAW